MKWLTFFSFALFISHRNPDRFCPFNVNMMSTMSFIIITIYFEFFPSQVPLKEIKEQRRWREKERTVKDIGKKCETLFHCYDFKQISTCMQINNVCCGWLCVYVSVSFIFKAHCEFASSTNLLLNMFDRNYGWNVYMSLHLWWHKCDGKPIDFFP